MQKCNMGKEKDEIIKTKRFSVLIKKDEVEQMEKSTRKIEAGQKYQEA